MDHNGVQLLHVCPTKQIAPLNEVEEPRVETDYKKFSNKK